MANTQKERVIKLIDALRSGKYKQGTGLLRPTCGTHCCLGVACDLSGCDQWNKLDEEFIYDDSSSLLPSSVMDFYGFRTKDGTHFLNGPDTLVEMNDAYVPFPEIADRIEHCLNHPETKMFV